MFLLILISQSGSEGRGPRPRSPALLSLPRIAAGAGRRVCPPFPGPPQRRTASARGPVNGPGAPGKPGGPCPKGGLAAGDPDSRSFLIASKRKWRGSRQKKNHALFCAAGMLRISRPGERREPVLLRKSRPLRRHGRDSYQASEPCAPCRDRSEVGRNPRLTGFPFRALRFAKRCAGACGGNPLSPFGGEMNGESAAPALAAGTCSPVFPLGIPKGAHSPFFVSFSGGSGGPRLPPNAFFRARGGFFRSEKDPSPDAEASLAPPAAQPAGRVTSSTPEI